MLTRPPLWCNTQWEHPESWKENWICFSLDLMVSFLSQKYICDKRKCCKRNAFLSEDGWKESTHTCFPLSPTCESLRGWAVSPVSNRNKWWSRCMPCMCWGLACCIVNEKPLLRQVVISIQKLPQSCTISHRETHTSTAFDKLFPRKKIIYSPKPFVL